MKIDLPKDYPNSWDNLQMKWVDDSELKLESYHIYRTFENFQHNNDYLIIFLSKKFSPNLNEYAIVAWDVMEHLSSIMLDDLNILGQTKTKDADFGLNMNKLGRQIINYSKVDKYQYLERYYLGVVESAKELKSKILRITGGYWDSDPSIEVF